MAYSFKGSIAFGLVYIPVKLEKCIKLNDISFHQLDRNTMSRITYQKSCRACDGNPVDNKDIVKAYHYGDEQYVLFEDADFEKIKTKKDKNITIERFVNLDEIDPIYFDVPYFVIPTGGEKAYALLLDTLQSERKVGIAKSVLGQKETLCALRVRDGAMILNTLHFYSELKKNPVGELSQSLTDAEKSMAKLLLDSMSGAFNAQEFHDEYTQRVMDAIEAKVAGKQLAAPKESPAKIADLMEALRASIAQNVTDEKKEPSTDGGKLIATQTKKQTQKKSAGIAAKARK